MALGDGGGQAEPDGIMVGLGMPPKYCLTREGCLQGLGGDPGGGSLYLIIDFPPQAVDPSAAHAMEPACRSSCCFSWSCLLPCSLWPPSLDVRPEHQVRVARRRHGGSGRWEPQPCPASPRSDLSSSLRCEQRHHAWMDASLRGHPHTHPSHMLS